MLHDILFSFLVIYGISLNDLFLFLPLLSLILKLPTSALLTEVLLIVSDCSVLSLMLKYIYLFILLTSLPSLGRLIKTPRLDCSE